MSQQQTLGRTATNVKTRDGITTIQYHETDVVSFNHEGIILNTGGWFTSTTKTRMNQASNQFDLGYYVKQVGGKWYCDFKGRCYDFDGNILKLAR